MLICKATGHSRTVTYQIVTLAAELDSAISTRRVDDFGSTSRLNMNNLVEKAGVLAQLPAELRYLIEPVLRCGCQSQDEALEYANHASAEQLNLLAEIAGCVLVHDHYPAVGKFL